MNYRNLRALLIDIDNTIVCLRRPPDPAEGADQEEPIDPTSSLLNVLRSAAVKLSGLTVEEAKRRIEKIKNEIRWWHLSDFIVALDLNPKTFWRYAFDVERQYIEATGPEIGEALQRLQSAGVLLYITSNNPSSGILHKLHLAGLGTVNGSTLFRQVLGPPELQAMKWDSLYWKKALAHIALDADEVAVVGDNPRDDCSVPLSIGISHSFLINRSCDHSANNCSTITHIGNFTQIADCLLNREQQRSIESINMPESLAAAG